MSHTKNLKGLWKRSFFFWGGVSIPGNLQWPRYMNKLQNSMPKPNISKHLLGHRQDPLRVELPEEFKDEFWQIWFLHRKPKGETKPKNGGIGFWILQMDEHLRSEKWLFVFGGIPSGNRTWLGKSTIFNGWIAHDGFPCISSQPCL